MFACDRCVSCLSARWKCYWDQENHLCVSNKDESNLHLIEVSNGAAVFVLYDK